MASFSPRDTLANRLIVLGCLLLLTPCLLAAIVATFYGWPIAVSLLPAGHRPVGIAQPGEILILVTELEGSTGTNPTDQIDQALRNVLEVFRYGSYIPRPARIGRLADTPLSEQDARELGRHYDATFVLWGEYDSSDTYKVTCTNLQSMRELEPDQFTLTLQQGNASDTEDLADLLLAIALHHSGNYYDAESLLNGLNNKINPTIVAFYHTEVYRAMGDQSNALSVVETALNIAPDDTLLLTLKASVLLDQLRYEEALEITMATLEQNPSLVEVYLLQGTVHQAMGDAQSALADYNNALELEPDNTAALRARAQTYQTLGDTQAALSDYAAAIEIEPKDYQNYLARALLYTIEGDKEAALADFEQALLLAEAVDALDFMNPYLAQTQVLEAQARALRSLGEYTQALEAYGSLDSLYPSVGHEIERGMVYWEMGDQAQAHIVWNESIQDSSGTLSAAGLNDLAWSLAMQGYYEPALGYSERSLELDPLDVNSLHTRGYIHLGLKEYQAALDDFEKALDNGLNYPPVYRDMADAYARLGKYRQAIDNYQTYLHLMPYAEDRYQVEKRLEAAQAAYQP